MTEKEKIYQILDEVTDPEIPVLTIHDMGIIREIRLKNDDELEVVITPTYSGCPAMNTIEENIVETLKANGYEAVSVTTVLSPPWTTDWLSEAGKRKLREYGIAPPLEGSVDKTALFAPDRKVPCPHCGDRDTVIVSQFGSTPCKALYKCNSCLEPFDYFKCH